MRVRILKPLPAPKIDGFDVRGRLPDCVYEVDARTGRYLIIAGYAAAVENDADVEVASRRSDDRH
jgi:hypothetical protein